MANFPFQTGCMKNCVWLLLLCSVKFCEGQIRWDGGASTANWNDAANWFPDQVPAGTDDVILDHSFVSGAYSVVLPSGAISTAVRSLQVTPTGTDSITLWLPASNTADPGLLVTGSGESLILNSYGRLINASGSVSGTGINITGIFKISNGGHYIHRTSRANAGIVSQLSLSPGTATGVFEFDTPGGSYTVSLSNRVFGSLILSAAAAGGTKSYVGSGSNPCTVRGDLLIRAGVTFSLGMSASGHFTVNRNLQTETGSILNLQNAAQNNILKLGADLLHEGIITETGTGLPVMEFNGTGPQQFTGSGIIRQSVTVQMNNSQGLHLLTALEIPYQLLLGNGKIISNASALLILADNATVSGANAGSFVEGPVRKTGDEDFIFPLGRGGIFAPLGIEGGTGAQATDEFTAEYHRANPQAIYGSTYAGGIDHISYVEYWTLTRAGSSTKNISIDVRESSFCRVPASSFVCSWDGPQWKALNSLPMGFAACGAYQCGRLLTTVPVSDFLAFTIGTSDPFTVNPLPVPLLYFRIRSQPDKVPIQLEWSLAGPPGPGTAFRLLRAGKDQRWIPVHEAQASNGILNYQFADNSAAAGINFYRLQLTDVGADTVNSPVLRTELKHQGLEILQVWPQPVYTSFGLKVHAQESGWALLELKDMSGRLVIRHVYQLAKGISNSSFSVPWIPAGVYRIQLRTAGKTVSATLLKY